MWWFTADEHYCHKNIMKYCDRPFESTEEMDEHFIKVHNDVVDINDEVVHVGDFTLQSKPWAVYILRYLRGNHRFIRGSHDYWLKREQKQEGIWRRKIYGQQVVCCHYAMRVWPLSHHGSWNLHGHSHGNLEPFKNQLDVGVDNAKKLLGEYRPFSFDEVKEILNGMVGI